MREAMVGMRRGWICRHPAWTCPWVARPGRVLESPDDARDVVDDSLRLRHEITSDRGSSSRRSG